MQWFFNIQVGYYKIYMSITAYTLGRSGKLGNDRKWWKSSAHTVHVWAWRRCWRLCWGSNGAVHKVIGLIKKKRKNTLLCINFYSKSVTANHENKNMFSSGPLWPLSTVKICTSMISDTFSKHLWLTLGWLTLEGILRSSDWFYTVQHVKWNPYVLCPGSHWSQSIVGSGYSCLSARSWSTQFIKPGLVMPNIMDASFIKHLVIPYTGHVRSNSTGTSR